MLWYLSAQRLIRGIERGKVFFLVRDKRHFDKLVTQIRAKSSNDSLPDKGWLFIPRIEDFDAATGLALENKLCLVCHGLALIDCRDKSCSGGSIPADPVKNVIGTNPITGDKLIVSRRQRKSCPKCDGNGKETCPYCVKGIPSGY